MFYGLNTFLALYFINRWHLSAGQGNNALVVFLGTSIVGTLLGGWMADRVGRREVIRTGFTGAVVFLGVFLLVNDRNWALVVLVPLAVFIFMPTSVLVVLGQEYLPRRVGVASGVTLGLAVSVGGMCAPLLGRLATWRGLAFRSGPAPCHVAGGDGPGVCAAADTERRNGRARTYEGAGNGGSIRMIWASGKGQNMRMSMSTSRKTRWLPVALVAGLAVALSDPGRVCGQTAQENSVRAVREVLDRQVVDWNRGDLDAFLAGYWKSPKVVFQSGGQRVRWLGGDA